MKAYCDGLNLGDAVLKVGKAVGIKGVNPILEGIKITASDDEIILVGTDSELTIEKRIKADVKIKGETIVPGKLFTDFVKKLANEQIELELNEKNQLKLRYTDSETLMQCLNPAEYPATPVINETHHFEMKEVDFKDVIEKTIFAVATDDTRPILKGCLLELEEGKITSVALDGYRLAKSSKPLISQTATGNIVVPGRSLNEISKLLDDTEKNVTVKFDTNYLMVQIDDTKVITRLIQGDFIQYKQIINLNTATEVVINKEQFELALERASILSRMNNDYNVRFEIKESVMTISARSSIGNVVEKITITLNGNDITIGFDGRYFRECLRTVKDDYIRLSFSSAISPCIVRPNGVTEDFLFLILPLRQF